MLTILALLINLNMFLFYVTVVQNPFLDELFENLQTLCNIFIVKADNLAQVFSEEPYVSCVVKITPY